MCIRDSLADERDTTSWQDLTAIGHPGMPTREDVASFIDTYLMPSGMFGRREELVRGLTLNVRRGAWPLKAIELDCNAIPDAAMTLAVMALYAQGTTRLTNIASWRVKETDRIAAMATELRKLGATVQAGDDFIAVTPPERWRAASIHTYDDHRIAMCFSLAAFNPLALSLIHI